MSLAISTTKRDKGTAEALRASGKIPAVVYGPERPPESIAVDYNTFAKLYDEAGESTLVDFSVDGGEVAKVLIQDVQYDPVKRTISHVDFRQIKMGEEMYATVELRLVGEAPAVKALGGTLVTGTHDIEIKCLPSNLVNHIDIDLNSLQTFDDSIHVSDIALPETITVITNPGTMVAKVSAPLTDEQIKALEEENTTGVDQVKVEEKGKKEEPAAEAPAA